MKQRLLTMYGYGLIFLLVSTNTIAQINQLVKCNSSLASPINREHNAIVFDGKLYFTGITAKGDSELVEIFKTPNGVYNTQFFDVVPGLNKNKVEHSGDPHEYLVADGSLYFVATDTNYVQGLYKFKNGVANKIKPSNEAIESPSNLVFFEERIYFMAKKEGSVEKILRYYDPTDNTLWSVTIDNGLNEQVYLTGAQFISVVNDSTLSYIKKHAGKIHSYDIKAAKKIANGRLAIYDFNSSRSNRERGTISITDTIAITDVEVGMGNYFVAIGSKIVRSNNNTFDSLAIGRVNQVSNLYFNEGILYFSHQDEGTRIANVDITSGRMGELNFPVTNSSPNAILYYSPIAPSTIVTSESNLGDVPANIVTSESNLGDVPAKVEIFNPESNQLASIHNDEWVVKSNTILLNGEVYLFGRKNGENLFEVLHLTKSMVTGVFSATEENQIAIYPNPGKSFIRVISNESKLAFEIQNSLGQTFQVGQISEGYIQISDLSSGVYILKLENGKSQVFVKE
ncbi:MAG: T9SS type A sorting domain-containing protein [Cytophagaceae bacterium]|jgi:hypothetical protein|nr:T9SS type A sorting domain-containing protein [Cytophagaceae bacterium]